MSTLKVSTLRNEANSSDVAINRTTSDGTIIDLQKDGSTVGSIGVVNNNNPFIANDADNSGLQFGTNQIIPHYDSLQRDNAVDLGSSSVRFKDLYLSGGVYLGGTGSANYLDDYEEGDWTPTVSSGTINPSQNYYTKVGQQVHINFHAYDFSDRSSSTEIEISGLPFTPNARQVGSILYRWISATYEQITVYLGEDGNMYLKKNVNGSSYSNVQHSELNNAGSHIYVSLSYRTAS